MSRAIPEHGQEASTETLLLGLYEFAYPDREMGRASGVAFVRSLINEGEYALALEDMCAVLLAGHRRAPTPQRDLIKRIAERIGLMDSGFVRAVLAGRTEMPPPEELPLI